MTNKILLVDDNKAMLSTYQRNLNRSFDVYTASSGAKGINLIKEQGPFAVVVSEFSMPDMNGIQVLTKVREITPDTVRIMHTNEVDVRVLVDAINKGNIFRFLIKPCLLECFAENLEAGVEQYRHILSDREMVEKSLKGGIKLLTEVLAANPVVFPLASRIQDMVIRLAVRLNIEKSWEIEVIGLLSLIGCVKIPAEILKKKYSGAVLTPEENETYLAHPQIGGKILDNIPRVEQTAEAIRYQMKQYDGGGLPVNSTRGNNIPVAARILKVVCDYELHTTAGKNPIEAVNLMKSNQHWYDPEVFATLKTEIQKVKEGLFIRSVFLKDVGIGMILADDIIDKKGALLVSKGQEITEVLKMRLFSYAQLGTVSEPIKILERVSKLQN